MGEIESSSRLTRRTVVQAAWMAPVVAVAAAMPAMAASGDDEPTVESPFQIVLGTYWAGTDHVTVHLRNAGATAEVGPVAVTFSGTPADAFSVWAVAGWSTGDHPEGWDDGGPGKPNTFIWNGVLAPSAITATHHFRIVYPVSPPPSPVTLTIASSTAGIEPKSVVFGSLG